MNDNTCTCGGAMVATEIEGPGDPGSGYGPEHADALRCSRCGDWRFDDEPFDAAEYDRAGQPDYVIGVRLPDHRSATFRALLEELDAAYPDASLDADVGAREVWVTIYSAHVPDPRLVREDVLARIAKLEAKL